MFDAAFNAGTGEMKFTVKVCPRLKFYSKMDFTTELKNQYLNAFIQQVPQYWNNRFQIKLVKKEFEALVVKPVFEVQESSISDAHFDLVILPNANDDVSICVRTGEDPQLAQLRNTKYYKSDFDQYAGKLSAQFTQVTLILEDKSRSVLNFLKEPLSLAVDSKPGNAKFSLNTMEALRTFANTVQTCFKGWKKSASVTVTGPGPNGKSIAEDVGRILKTFGLTAKFKYEGKGPEGMFKLSVDRKQLLNLEMEVMSATHRVSDIAQYAAVHEYGHMLGLPDEYICYSQATLDIMAKKSTGLVSKTGEEKSVMQTQVDKNVTMGQSKSQTEFIRLCRLYGVPVPPFGNKNPSLMSSGHQFQVCHGVTIADTLQKMTAKDTEAKDWRIDLVRR